MRHKTIFFLMGVCACSDVDETRIFYEPTDHLNEQLTINDWQVQLNIGTHSSPPHLEYDSTQSAALHLWVLDFNTNKLLHRGSYNNSWGNIDSEIINFPNNTGPADDGVTVTKRVSTPYWSMLIRGSDGNLWHRYGVDPSPSSFSPTWASWDNSLGNVVARPAIVSDLSGNPYIFAPRAGGVLSVSYWVPSVGWSSWVDFFPGGLHQYSSVSASRRGTSDYIDVVYRGVDDNIWEAPYSISSKNFYTSTNLGAPPGGISSNVYIGGAVNSRGNNQVDVWTANFYQNYIWRKSWISGVGWDTDWDVSPSISEGNVLDVGETPSAVYRSSAGVDLAVMAYSTPSYTTPFQANYRLFNTPPSSSVVLSQDRVLRGTWTSSNDVSCNSPARFEGTAVAVPSSSSCFGGSFIYAFGRPVGQLPFSTPVKNLIWKSSLNCISGSTSGSTSLCSSTNSPYCDTSSSDVYQLIPNTTTLELGAPPTGGGLGWDNQTVRLRGTNLALPNQSSILHFHQSSVYATVHAPSIVPQTLRGVEHIFRSTDCGGSFSYVRVLDACDPNFDNSYGCNYGAVSGDSTGFDRPELVVSKKTPQNVYLATRMVGAGPNKDASLFKSTDFGNNWSFMAHYDDGIEQVSEIEDRVFLAESEENVKVSLTSPGTKDLYFRWHNGAIMVRPSKSLAKLTTIGSSYVDYFGSTVQISPIGKYGPYYYVRIVYTIATNPQLVSPGVYSANQKIRVSILKITDPSTVDVISTSDVQLSGTGVGMYYPTIIDSDRIDVSQNNISNVALLYWYESDTPAILSSTSAMSGNVIIKGCVLRGMSPICSSPQILSVDDFGAGPVSRSSQAIPPGHYMKGAFFYAPSDPDGKTFQFVPQWRELHGSTEGIHANIVKVRP